MKNLLAPLALAFLMVGCLHSAEECHYHHGNHHCHDYPVSHGHQSTTVVHTSANNGGGSNNIIVIEEYPSYCNYDFPYYHDPEYCTFEGITCCTWANIGEEEEWCYYDGCGWELVSVYSYY